MRPRSIVLFERIYAFVIVISIAVTIWAYFNMSRLIPTLPPDVPSNMTWLIPVMATVTAGVGAVIKLLLLYFIARRASDVARWILVVLFVLGLVSLINVVAHPELITQTWTIGLSLFSTVLVAACVWLLFRPDSKAWFRGERTPDNLHGTFS